MREGNPAAVDRRRPASCAEENAREGMRGDELPGYDFNEAGAIHGAKAKRRAEGEAGESGK